MITELGYNVRRTSQLQRALQQTASLPWVARLLSTVLHPMDRASFRATGGRHTVASLLAGLPVIMLTTIGAKTGKVRTMPLLGIPIDESLAAIGSNFGGISTPGWVYNLEADPSATVSYRDRTVPVTARRASGGENERAFELAAAVYGAFPAYRDRAAHRDIRVFILESAD